MLGNGILSNGDFKLFNNILVLVQKVLTNVILVICYDIICSLLLVHKRLVDLFV